MTTEDKALVLLNEVSLYKCENVDTAPHKDLCTALRRAIEQHEAFRQKVSDAVDDTVYMVKTHCETEALTLLSNRLNRFIIPKPKPDPLVEVLTEVDTGNGWDDEEDYARQIHKALEARGFEIREKSK